MVEKSSPFAGLARLLRASRAVPVSRKTASRMRVRIRTARGIRNLRERHPPESRRQRDCGTIRTMEKTAGTEATGTAAARRRREPNVSVEAKSVVATTTEDPSAPQVADGPAPQSIAPAVEALLLSIDKPLSPYRIAQALGLISDDDERHADHPLMAAEEAEVADEPGVPTKRSKKRGVKKASPVSIVNEAVRLLNSQYEATTRAFRVEEVAGGYRLMTLPVFASVLEAYHGRRERASLSRAAVETLAIIAYKQPMTRAGLEAIRGVACGEILRSLMERRLVTIVGRAEELGRPMLYGTTKGFLEVFGLTTVKDLPSVEEFKQRTGGGAADED